MEAKVYESKRRVTLKDGTVREYISRRKYTPKGAKEVKKGDIIDTLKRIDDKQSLKEIKEFIDKYDRKPAIVEPAENRIENGDNNLQ
jgi:hypothetical protein